MRVGRDARPECQRRLSVSPDSCSIAAAFSHGGTADLDVFEGVNSEEAITPRVGKSQESIERAKVVRVSVRDNSHRTRNMLLGSGILGGMALGVAAVPLGAASNEGNSCPVCVAVIAAGFGGGAGLGAIPGIRTVYGIKK